MAISSLIAAVFVLTSAIMGSASLAATQPKGTASLSAEKQPNHLEPICPYDDNGYTQAVFESFLQDKLAEQELWMIVRPSFSVEYAVLLLHNNKTEKWFIEYAVAKKPIWQWKDTGEGRYQHDIKVTKDIDRSKVEVTPEFAKIIKDAWQAVLRKTRYADKDFLGADGVTYQFYCGSHYGETWSPSSGLPKMITDLGLKLRDIPTTDDDKRKNLISECQALAKKIKSQADKSK